MATSSMGVVARTFVAATLLPFAVLFPVKVAFASAAVGVAALGVQTSAVAARRKRPKGEGDRERAGTRALSLPSSLRK